MGYSARGEGALAFLLPQRSCGRLGCCCHPRRRAKPRAAGSGLLHTARSPSGSLPAREALQGEPRRLRGGAGARVRSTRSPPGPGQGVRAPGPAAGSSRAGVLEKAESLGGQPSWASARLGGTLCAGPGRVKQGAQQERVNLRPKNKKYKINGLGIGARSADSDPTGDERTEEPQLSPDSREVQDQRGLWRWNRAASAFSETTARLGQISQANSRSLLLTELAKAYFLFCNRCHNRKKRLALQSSSEEETCRLAVSASSAPSTVG